MEGSCGGRGDVRSPVALAGGEPRQGRRSSVEQKGTGGEEDGGAAGQAVRAREREERRGRWLECGVQMNRVWGAWGRAPKSRG